MRNFRKLFRVTIAAGGLTLLLGTNSQAYFEIELVTGGTVLADSYTEDGPKLHLYRPSGALDVDRSSVKAIREREGSVPDRGNAQPVVPAATSPEPVKAPATKREVVESAPAFVIPETEDPAKLEEALTMKLILSNRDMLFARNAGEDKKALDSRKKEIEALEKRREAVRERLER